jgi:hypothetical protein
MNWVRQRRLFGQFFQCGGGIVVVHQPILARPGDPHISVAEPAVSHSDLLRVLCGLSSRPPRLKAFDFLWSEKTKIAIITPPRPRFVSRRLVCATRIPRLQRVDRNSCPVRAGIF